MMEIQLQLDDEYVRKLAYIQEQTEQELIEAIQSAIAIRYEQLQQNEETLKIIEANERKVAAIVADSKKRAEERKESLETMAQFQENFKRRKAEFWETHREHLRVADSLLGRDRHNNLNCENKNE
ncbi:MAG: hypothetical protein SXA11_07325 [Cyanobacteriota bacterium]|nr:hypothetical protein [Cyanobacteriota bacterium]